MRTKTPTGKASKGSVQVIASNGRLQLRFRYAGKRRYLPLGFPDDRDNRLAAEMKARQIQLDILSGNFDETSAKYKPQSSLAIILGTAEPPCILLSKLWEKYTEYRKPQIAETTLRIPYAAVASHINKLPCQTIDRENAVAIRDFYLKNLTTETTKRTITQRSACCEWAVDSGLLTENPFKGMAKKIRISKPHANKREEDE